MNGVKPKHYRYAQEKRRENHIRRCHIYKRTNKPEKVKPVLSKKLWKVYEIAKAETKLTITSLADFT
jgi:hypothetical protein